MRRMMLGAVLGILAAGTRGGQEKRVEITNATPDDAKPNSNAVPDGYAISGQFQRVMILRFKNQTDLLAAMESIVKQNKIRSAVILAGAGSVRNYHVHAVSNRTFPTKDVFVENATAPADIVSMNGYVIDGRIHVHMTMANADKAFGGHLEPGTNVFTFAIVTLGILGDEVDLRRIDDKNYR